MTIDPKNPFPIEKLPDIVMREIYDKLELDEVKNLQEAAKSVVASEQRTGIVASFQWAMSSLWNWMEYPKENFEGWKRLADEADQNVVWIPFAERIGVPLEIKKLGGTKGTDQGLAKTKTLKYVKDLIKIANSEQYRSIIPAFIKVIIDRAKSRKLTFEDAATLNNYITVLDTIKVRNAIAKAINDDSEINLNQDFDNLKAAADGFAEWLKAPERRVSVANLEELTLSHQGLKALPKELSSLTHLKTLRLEDNFLRDLPKVICSFRNLKELALNSNYLRDLPEELGVLTQLESLDLTSNPITKVPKVISSLTNLIYLSFFSTPLKDLPEELCSLTNLKTLVLRWTSVRKLPENLNRHLHSINCEILFPDYHPF